VEPQAGAQTYREGPRSWLADQLLEPTKLVFAIVIAESLREYGNVLTSPIHNGHYIASLALAGVYLTTVWSWLGWHTAHLKYPYEVRVGDGPNRSEIMRFYADLSIVIAYAYTLFQVEPLVHHPRANLVWLLLGYPIIILLYGAENLLRRMHYGGDARRTVPLASAFLVFVAMTVAYVFIRREFTPAPHGSHDLLWLNGTTLSAYIVAMWGYRRFNDYFKARITPPAATTA
jgi:hypothetical protein